METKKNRKRRGRGEGGIYRRADGLWCGSVSAGYNEHGKRRRRVEYGKTKQEVQKKLRNTQHLGLPNITKLTVGEFLDRWLEATVKASLEATTHDRYERVIRKHLKPYLGGMRLATLAPAHIEAMYAQQAREKTSKRNSELSGVILQTAMKHAVRLKLIPFNPVADIDKPRPQKREMAVWNREEATGFLKAAKGDRLHAMYALALASGMREGELFGLKWSDIDFKGAAVSVNRTLEEIGGRFRLKEPKTAKSRRRIDLPEFAINALHDHRKRMLSEGNAGGPVFCDRKGGFLRVSNVHRRSFVPLIKAAKVRPIRFHDMRHTAATLLLLAGVHPKIVSERLGHASIEITLNTYSHVLPGMQKEAAQALGKLLG